jgi:hypothetical protein
MQRNKQSETPCNTSTRRKKNQRIKDGKDGIKPIFAFTISTEYDNIPRLDN